MVLFFGDLHLYDGKVASHHDYEKECLDIMDGIVEGCEEIKKGYCANDEDLYIVFSGDLSGALAAKRFRTLTFRAQVCAWLLRLNELTDGRVYSILGNHDYSSTDMTELVFFMELGLIKPLDTLDIEKDKVRVIGLNYGELNKEFEVKHGVLNVAVIHNNVAFNDINMGFYKGNYDYIEETKSLKNVDFIYAGHIHNPTNVYTKEIYEDKPINLLYLGCPTRPAYEKNMWDYVNIGVVQKGVTNVFTLEVAPAESVFNLTAIDIDETDETEDRIVTSENVEEDMKAIIGSLLNYDDLKFFSSIQEQIKMYPNYSDDAKKRALKYYEDKLMV